MQSENKETPLEEQKHSFPSLRPSRDTWLLIAALAFLILAVGLTSFISFIAPSLTPAPTTAIAIADTVGTSSPATEVVEATIEATRIPPIYRSTVTPLSEVTPSPDPSIAAYPFISATNVKSATIQPTGVEPSILPSYPAPPSPVGSPLTQSTQMMQTPTFAPNRPTLIPTYAPPSFGSPTGATRGILQQTATTPTVVAIATVPSFPTHTLAPTLSSPSPLPTVVQPTTVVQIPPMKGQEPLKVTPTVSPSPAPEVDVVQGHIRWRTDQSPIIVRRSLHIAPGAMLIIEPGVEVRLGSGVAIYVDKAQFLALGLPERPVRFVSESGIRWEGLYTQPDSYVTLDHTEVSGGGAGGSLFVANQSNVTIRHTRFRDNGGTILLNDTRLEMRNSEIAGNDLPYGATLDLTYTYGNVVILAGNRISGNRLSPGTPNVRLANQSSFDTLNLDLQGNLLRGGVNNLLLTTNGPIQGTIACNALVGNELGLSLRTQTVQTPGFNLSVFNNLIDHHTPPIIPVYLEYGIGRGAASEVVLDMRNNWWGDSSGPYDPQANQLGRGDSVGDNITYAPWLSERPSCVPPE